MLARSLHFISPLFVSLSPLSHHPPVCCPPPTPPDLACSVRPGVRPRAGAGHRHGGGGRLHAPRHPHPLPPDHRQVRAPGAAYLFPFFSVRPHVANNLFLAALLGVTCVSKMFTFSFHNKSQQFWYTLLSFFSL